MSTRTWIGLAAAVLLAGCGGRVKLSPLTAAAAAGNVDEIRRLVAAGTSPNALDESGQTALGVAARAGQVAAIAALVEAGADVNLIDQRTTRWPPLVHALHKRQNEAALALLAAGAQPDPVLWAGARPLMFAAAYGDLPLVQELLARGADPRAETEDGVTAVWAAAGGGAFFDLGDGPLIGTCFPEIVNALLEKAPELRIPRDFSTRLIHFFADTQCDALLARLEVRSR